MGLCSACDDRLSARHATISSAGGTLLGVRKVMSVRYINFLNDDGRTLLQIKTYFVLGIYFVKLGDKYNFLASLWSK